MKRISQFFCLIVVITAFSLAALAQDTLSPAKRKLIAELIVVTKMDKQMDEMTNVFLSSQDAMYAGIVRQLLEGRPGLTPKEKEALEKEMVDRFKTFVTKFKERLPAAVNYSEYIEQAVYPIYDKAFTEKELADLVAFYKSDTGQKVLVAMPQLVVEAMEVAQRVLVPRVVKMVEGIVAEELADLKEGPPPAKKN